MHLAAAWARRRGVPYLVTSESHPRAHGLLRRGAKRLLAGRLVRRASGWLPVSSRAEDLLVALGADRARCRHVPNAPDTERFAAARRDAAGRARTRAELAAGDAPVTLFVGRLVPAKGLDVLLEAAARVSPRPTLWVAGGGPLAEPLSVRAAALGLGPSVRFLGDASYDRVTALWGAADLAVLPSVHEPYGVSLHEGMAAGCAGLATEAVGAALDLIEPGVTGARVPAGDPAALAQAWGRLLADPARLARMGEAAAAKAASRGRDFAVRQTEDATLAAIAAAAAVR
jgi:glycosyltransferase involved in cell wall biosynthesis